MNSENRYLKVPLCFTQGYLDKIPLRESVSQFVGIIIGSRLNSFSYDPDFGCRIWESEYSYFSPGSESDFRTYLRNAISKNEKRLKDISVEIKQDFIEPYRNKSSLIAQIKGKYMENGVENSFEEDYVFWQPPWSEEKQR